jgi:hypothetical protein
VLDVEKIHKMLDLLYTFRDLNKEIENLEREINKILIARLDLGFPADVIKNIEVEIKERPFREVKIAPLRCEETIYYINRVAIREHDLVLEGSAVRHEARLTVFSVYDLLTLACNLEVSEVEMLLNAVREKKRELEEDLAKLKELVAYAKLILS